MLPGIGDAVLRLPGGGQFAGDAIHVGRDRLAIAAAIAVGGFEHGLILRAVKHEFERQQALHRHAFLRQIVGIERGFILLDDRRLHLFQADALAVRIIENALEAMVLQHRAGAHDLDRGPGRDRFVKGRRCGLIAGLVRGGAKGLDGLRQCPGGGGEILVAGADEAIDRLFQHAGHGVPVHGGGAAG